MCPVQTSYAAEHAVAFEGQRADFGLVDVISKVAEADLPFGLAAIRGTADNQAILPSATGGSFLGVTEYTTAWAADAADVHQYEQYREANILTFGRVWVICEDGCSPGDAAFFRHTAGAGGTVIGSFRTDADTATADAVPGGTFETTAAAGGLALLKLRDA